MDLATLEKTKKESGYSSFRELLSISPPRARRRSTDGEAPSHHPRATFAISLIAFPGVLQDIQSALATPFSRRERVGDLVEPAPATVEASASVASAAALMAQARRRVLLVLDGGRPVGQLEWSRVRDLPPQFRETTPVSALMVPSPITLEPRDSAVVALRRMRETGLDRLPVLDGGQLVGVVRREDLLRMVDLGGL